MEGNFGKSASCNKTWRVRNSYHWTFKNSKKEKKWNVEEYSLKIKFQKSFDNTLQFLIDKDSVNSISFFDRLSFGLHKIDFCGDGL